MPVTFTVKVIGLESVPDVIVVVLVAGVGGPGVLPQITLRDQGYKGTIYQTHGVATDDFIRLAIPFLKA